MSTRWARLSLETRYENIVLAERVLTDLLVDARIPGDEHYWLVTAVREAIANAMRHGHREDPSFDVLVQMAVEEDELQVEVADEGHGFDPNDVPDPTDPENLLRPCGRGIFYMNRFMDVVRFGTSDRGGTLVEMKKRFTDLRDKENTS